MPEPTADMWRNISASYSIKWQFPNCIGSLDGKHVVIQCPRNSGSQYFNYKGSFSVVLLALVDADYRFTPIDVGSFGRNSDGGIFAQSTLGIRLESNKLNIPQPEKIPGAGELGPMPYVIVADAAFPIKSYMMRPYPGQGISNEHRIFNYRLSRARRVVENAFGIMASRWQIHSRRITLDPKNVDKVIKATCILHNFMREELCSSNDTPTHGLIDTDAFAAPMVDLQSMRGNRGSREAMEVREKFSTYFNSSAGSVPWQNSSIGIKQNED